MKLKQIYDMAIKIGMENDPREIKEVKNIMKKAKKEYDQLDNEEKELYDQDKLENPYSDTRILVDDDKKEIKTVMMGIDIDTSEILLADRLNEKGKNIDAVIAHHPVGKALAGLHEVMHMQEEMLRDLGISINIAEGIMAERIPEVERRVMPLNHNKVCDAAKALNIPLMNVHTPADNLVSKFLQERIDQSDVKTLKDVIKLLKSIYEYRNATKLKSGPKIIVGSEDRSAGKVVVNMTGGTSGSKDVYEKLADSGVGTLITMHISEEHRKKAEKNHINVIVAGHIASDSIGMNIFADKLEEKGIKIIPCSGFIRKSRV
jgi:putative NIF3 family GTP cyclohydrolase 1 type 2